MNADTRPAAPAARLAADANAQNSISKSAACAAFFGAGISFTLIALLHALEPQYDPSWRFVSEYAVGPFGWMMQLAFGAMALSFGSLAISLRGEVNSQLGKVGIAVLLLSAAGCAIAGDLSNRPHFASTGPAELERITPWSWLYLGNPGSTGCGNAHHLSAYAIAGLAILETTPPVAGECDLDFASRNVRADGAWLSAHHGQFGPDVPVGWLNRIVIVTYLAWAMLTAAAAAGIAQGRRCQAAE